MWGDPPGLATASVFPVAANVRRDYLAAMIRPSLIAAALGLLAAPALAQERPLGDAEMLQLADSQAVWCENWSEQTRDCESLYMLRREPDGSLISSGMFILSAEPEVRVVIADRVTLTDGRLCSSASTDELNIQATMAGQPSVQMSSVVRLLLAESMEEYADTTLCQQLLTTGDPAMLGEIITADDQRLYDFESTYRMGTAESGFILRPMVEQDADPGMTDL